MVAPRFPRTAIVTGASGAIGQACVAELMREGWTVLGVDRKPPPAAGASDQLRALQIDVAAPGAAADVIAHACGWTGRIDLLCNNAGIGHARPVHETADEDLARFMEVNFAAAFRLSREALPHMQSGAAVVHIASVVGLKGTPSTSAYAASKAALIGLTRQMAREYGPRGIRTNAVAPGLIETELVRPRLLDDPGFAETWRRGTPFWRLGQPDDVARAVRFLASEDAAFVNGHVLVVDGGWSATG